MPEEQQQEPSHTLRVSVAVGSITAPETKLITLGTGSLQELGSMVQDLIRFELVDNISLQRTDGRVHTNTEHLATWVQHALEHLKGLERT